MYRKRNGSLSFSFSRFITAAVPNFASDSAGYVDLTPQRRDMLYAHQLAAPKPEALDERAFYVAGVCDRERQSERIHYTLWRNGCLRDDDGTVDTSKIGPKFIHQLAFLSQTSQKNLINVLFFWEEEIQRMRKLSKEEEELDGLILKAEGRHGHDTGEVDLDAQTAGEGHLEDVENEERRAVDKETLDRLKFARERVRMKRRQRPTQRRPELEDDSDEMVVDAFRLSRRTTEAPSGLPPTYGRANYGTDHNPLGLPRHRSIS